MVNIRTIKYVYNGIVRVHVTRMKIVFTRKGKAANKVLVIASFQGRNV